MLPIASKFEIIVYSKMDITYLCRKINSNVFQNVLIPVFTIKACAFIATACRWLHSPSLSAHTHTDYTYKPPLPLNVGASLTTLNFEHRDTHSHCCATLTYWPGWRRQSCNERDVQILFTLL